MLTVHHLDNSRSQRVLWLLEELGVEYEIKTYKRVKMLAPPELYEVHPLGKAPVVTDGDRVLAESGAILEYLVEEYGDGRLRPEPGTDAFYQYRYWMHHAEGSAMTPLLVKLITHRVRKLAPFPVKPIANKIADGIDEGFADPRIKLHADFWESELGKHEWFAGDEFTAADIQMSFPIEAASSRGDTSAYPNVMAFVKRIRERPAYAAAIERGGPYQVA